ncbi:AGAP002591-PA-like protein [Anopheles sinensis]|uniref:AGAP002591-PA-like protein n=1 Tax=Anopheles sinensis TaxID=74873 RepID=A0A084WTB0_ANOSI|nr:AGAP002591-PA-like protein [Anopheles sinensis]
MLDPDLECGNECGGPGPPPEFLVPPPPRPPFLAELVNCNEEQQQPPFGAASPFGDVDMCEAFPCFDRSFLVNMPNPLESFCFGLTPPHGSVQV